MIPLRPMMLSSLAILGCQSDPDICIDEAEFGVTINSFAVSASETFAVVDSTITTVAKDSCDDDFGGGRALNSIRLADATSTTVIGGLAGSGSQGLLPTPPSRDVAVWAFGDHLGMVDMGTLEISIIDVSSWGSAGATILLANGKIAFPLGADPYIGVFDPLTEDLGFHSIPSDPSRIVEGDGSVYTRFTTLGTNGVMEISTTGWEVTRVFPVTAPVTVIALQGTSLAAYADSTGDVYQIGTITGETTFLAGPPMTIRELAYLAPHRWLGISDLDDGFLFDFEAGTVTTVGLGIHPGTPVQIAERGELFVPYYEGFAVIDVASGNVSYGWQQNGVRIATRLADGRIIGVRDVPIPRGAAPSSVDDAIRILDPALDYEVVERYPLGIPPEF